VGIGQETVAGRSFRKEQKRIEQEKTEITEKKMKPLVPSVTSCSILQKELATKTSSADEKVASATGCRPLSPSL